MFPWDVLETCFIRINRIKNTGKFSTVDANYFNNITYAWKKLIQRKCAIIRIPFACNEYTAQFNLA